MKGALLFGITSYKHTNFLYLASDTIEIEKKLNLNSNDLNMYSSTSYLFQIGIDSCLINLQKKGH